MATVSAPARTLAGVKSSLQVCRITVLECPALADLDCDRTQLGGDSVECGVERLRDGLESAYDACEVVLVFRRQFLDRRDIQRPYL